MNPEIYWFNSEKDKFVVCAEDLKLYQISENRESRYRLLETESKYSHMRCVAPSPSNQEITVACGFMNGKIAVVTFNQQGIPAVELPCRTPRTATCLAWKGYDRKIAVGYDKSRTDNCVSLWDIDRNPSGPINTFGGFDSPVSLCWEADQNHLIAGLSSKILKVFDVRVAEREVCSQLTKYIQGVQCAPFNGNYVASYADNCIVLHDLRSFDKQVTQIVMQKPIVQALWCPTRLSTIAAIHSDQFIHLYDVIEGNKESEPYIPSRCYSPFGLEGRNIVLTSISFHHKDFERLISLSTIGLIHDFYVPQKRAIVLDKNDSRIWSTFNGHEIKSVHFSLDSDPQVTKDSTSEINDVNNIAELMQERAKNDYGQIADIQQNGELAKNAQLNSVWKLLAHMYSKGCMLGLKSILGISSSQDGTVVTKSDAEYVEWCDYPSFTALKVYISEQRSFCQSLCGWNFERNDDESFNKYLRCLCTAKEYTKAAAIACFHLKLTLAVEILRKCDIFDEHESSILKVAGIAIQNYNPNKQWSSEDLHTQITDPYLRALFTFLNLESSHEGVLNDQELPLADRMAYACLYLSDTRLAEYIKSQVAKCIERGDLNGILLTGATSDGVSLLQSYLDWSEDIQSVSLIASRFFTEQFSNFKIQHWIATYRDLLDVWGLFGKRANFDIMLSSKSVPPKSIYLLCNFCGKSVSSSPQEETRMRASANKISSCPHCRKPLPRCSLCMLHLGTCSHDIQDKQNRRNNVTFQAKPFQNWFAWCQTCRHGGHMKHLNAWFSQYSECPVTSCECNCYDIDQPQFQKCN